MAGQAAVGDGDLESPAAAHGAQQQGPNDDMPARWSHEVSSFLDFELRFNVATLLAVLFCLALTVLYGKLEAATTTNRLEAQLTASLHASHAVRSDILHRLDLMAQQQLQRPAASIHGGRGSECAAPACTALSDAEWAASPPPAVLPLRYRALAGAHARRLRNGTYTVMLTVFKRHSLEKQIEALDNQTVRPSQIHVFQTGSYVNDTAALLARLNRSDISLIHVTGFDFKYHGRFLPLLMAESEFVAVLDDDVLPQRRWYERAMQFIQAHGPTTVVGSTGRLVRFMPSNRSETCAASHPCVAVAAFDSANGRDGQEIVYPIEVDFIIHSYVVRAELLRYFFAYPHYTWLNGEDISFCSVLQVAVGARCWLPPQSHADESMGDALNKGGVSAQYRCVYGAHGGWGLLRSVCCHHRGRTARPLSCACKRRTGSLARGFMMAIHTCAHRKARSFAACACRTAWRAT